MLTLPTHAHTCTPITPTWCPATLAVDRDSAGYKLGYQVGRVIGPILIVLLVVVVIWKLTRKSKA